MNIKLDDTLQSSLEEIDQTSNTNDDFEDEKDNNSGALLVRPSIISEGFEFTGEVKAAGSLTVEGSLVGKVFVDNLTVGTAGVVEGTVATRTVHVKGKLTGEISCSEISIGGRSAVDGKLTYSSITIQRGASVKGDLKKI